MKLLKFIFIIGFLTIAVYLVLLANPTVVFAHKIEYKQFTVWSDRPIEPGWNDVLDDAVRRLETSELYDKSIPIRIFVCNNPWRLQIFTRSTSVGGFADTFFTRNIFLREVVAANNQLIPPYGTLAEAQARPLSYFVAHEVIHVFQSRHFGRTVSISSPTWLVEGYADLIAKAGDFDFEKNLKLFKEDHPIMNRSQAKSGLYNRYHLMTEHVISSQTKSIVEIFQSPPLEEVVVSELKSRSFD